MKKIIHLLLVVTLSFTLVSCKTNNTNENNKNQSNQQTNDTLDDEVSMIISLSINPSFDIYVNDLYGEGIVSTVKANNQDAEKILENTCFDDLPLANCISLLLDILLNNNYLKNGSDLEIITKTSNKDLDFNSVILDEIETFKLNHNLSFNCNLTNDIVINNDQPALDESKYSYVEKDANGNIIKTVEEVDAIQDTPARKMTCFYDSNGMIQKKIIEETETKIIYEYQNNKKSKEIIEFKNGDFTETIYDSNELTVSEVGKRKDYSYEMTYKNGLKEKETQNHKNGKITIVVFYENSNKKSVENKMPDGTVGKSTYYENGNLESSHEYGPNGDNKYYYDMNGNKTRYEGKDNHGNPVTGTYNTDGSGVFETKLPDGSITISHIDANGKVISQSKK